MNTATSQDKGRLVERFASPHESSGPTLRRNLCLPGQDSRELCEIDVLIETRAADYSVRLTTECKNKRKPFGVERIDAFVRKLGHVGQ